MDIWAWFAVTFSHRFLLSVISLSAMGCFFAFKTECLHFVQVLVFTYNNYISFFCCWSNPDFPGWIWKWMKSKCELFFVWTAYVLHSAIHGVCSFLKMMLARSSESTWSINLYFPFPRRPSLYCLQHQRQGDISIVQHRLNVFIRQIAQVFLHTSYQALL